MEEQKGLASRLHDVERELKQLRAAFHKQSNTVGQLHDALAKLQSQIHAATAKRLPRSGSKLTATTQSWYVAAARHLLRVNIEDLFDRDYYCSRVLGLSESGTDPVFHYLFSHGAVSPHWLFDRDYYLLHNSDVAQAKTDPLVHFLRTGWREGRNPHPLFHTNFYLDQVSALRSESLNPVSHYMVTGWRTGLLPHPLFNGNYYLTRYPDIAGAGMDPLTHYVLFGAGEGRHPHEWFDTDYYRAHNHDVAQARVEPVRHYIEHGAAEGRDPHPLFDTLFYQDQLEALAGMSPLEHYVRHGITENRPTNQTDCVERFLPVVPVSPPPPRGLTVDIIVPVYRGLQETRACIESVLASQNREPFELIVINDKSPEPALTDWLRQSAATGTFTLLENETNQGFVATVNRGMLLHPDRDVILLNSDTTVANDWLDRMVRAAHRSPYIGTVTPFSNNATICSYPRFCEDNPLPPGTTASELDRIAALVNQGRTVDIPTAVGCCMYIRRDCLAQVGLFDVETFGKGYGEENDFSLRAAAAGWRNILAADTFVFHAGSVSFAKDSVFARDRGVLAVTERHPSYLKDVSLHVTQNRALPFRFALTAARFRASGKPTILLITHDLGGGIAQHIEELVNSLRAEVNFLELRPVSESLLLLRTADPAEGFSLTLDLTRQYPVLLSLLRSCNVTRIHIHHVLRHALSLETLRHDLDVPMEFTVHDYFAICPRFTLSKPDGKYCGEPDEAGCNECIRTTLPHLNLDIGSWRAKYAWLLNSANRVITPSADAATRMSRHFPAADIQPAVHPAQAPHPAVQVPRLTPDGTLRIAAVGVMSAHKGLSILERCAQIAKERKLPLEFVLVGYCEPQVLHMGPFTFSETGEYARDRLQEVLTATAPSVIWFPQRWPETFSYTLSTCLEEGWPIVASQLGALPERLSGRAWTWGYDWAIDPEALSDLFLRIRQSLVSGTAPHAPPPRPQADPAFYPKRYLNLPQPNSRPAVDLRESGRRSVIALLSSYESGQMQSTGYIRAYLPLKHDRVESFIRVAVTTPESALNMIADVLLVQRTTIPTIALAEELLAHCERHSMRIIYETDDDLFNIDTAHSDSSFYTPLIAPAERIAQNAALVIVSSPVLKERLAHLKPEIRVIPNALDEALWFEGKKPVHLPRKTTRILYMGTMTHSRDLELIEEPIRRLKAEFGPALEFDLIGIVPGHRRRDWFNMIEVPAIYGHSYPLFAEWIRDQNKWDFAVAPLVDDDFNRCKSYIKYLDYAALGLPAVFSGIGVFEPVVRHGETGLIVPDASGWYEAIRLLITDTKLRRQMGAAAYLDVSINHTLSAQHALRRNLWQQIGRLPPARSRRLKINEELLPAPTVLTY